MIIIKHIIDDGFNAELVSHAFFDGLLEIPIIEKPNEIIIPSGLIPFTQMKRSDTKSEAVHFYEHDKRFFDVLTCTKELLHKYDDSMYEIEFFDKSGNTLEVVTTPKHVLELILES